MMAPAVTRKMRKLAPELVAICCIDIDEVVFLSEQEMSPEMERGLFELLGINDDCRYAIFTRNQPGWRKII